MHRGQGFIICWNADALCFVHSPIVSVVQVCAQPHARVYAPVAFVILVVHRESTMGLGKRWFFKNAWSRLAASFDWNLACVQNAVASYVPHTFWTFVQHDAGQTQTSVPHHMFGNQSVTTYVNAPTCTSCLTIFTQVNNPTQIQRTLGSLNEICQCIVYCVLCIA